MIELRRMGFECKSQYPIRVFYESLPVGDYFADIIVDNCVIIENKAAEALVEENEYQLINYLKATNIEVMVHYKKGEIIENLENCNFKVTFAYN